MCLAQNLVINKHFDVHFLPFFVNQHIGIVSLLSSYFTLIICIVVIHIVEIAILVFRGSLAKALEFELVEVKAFYLAVIEF